MSGFLQSFYNVMTTLWSNRFIMPAGLIPKTRKRSLEAFPRGGPRGLTRPPSLRIMQTLMAGSQYRTAPEVSQEMPKGIPYIIGNEAAERFSYYGMRTPPRWAPRLHVLSPRRRACLLGSSTGLF